MLITVFTPTYNRAKLLKRLYDSLCVQTFTDIEWLIIDDGSVDNTEKIVNGFIAENKIGIRYIKQRNGGKHRAINHGVREAKGELFFIVDSDDWLPEDSLETINKYYQGIKDDKSFAGISGLDGFA
jgi:glycosyltransferase involved in cell wall biosynthesis